MINILFPKLHREGYRFLILAAILTFILFLFSNLLGFLGFILTVWVFYFFRDPERISINDQNYLVSPADGVISKIVKINGPEELGMDKKEFIRISIFMNVFDCHVNRVPSSGNVVDIFYKPGSFFNASLDKASEKNERNLIKFKTNNGEEIAIVQIAGLIARRIVCDCHKDQKLEQGERFGIIRFGSRVDVYLENFNVLVKENQKTIAGETLLAKK
tara:strand:- start:278 stop:925 length:648 start_codon:yes stop_codon:yes gene_type:complete